jgi:cobalt-zinc-cadmium efflux system membrane fusion protein
MNVVPYVVLVLMSLPLAACGGRDGSAVPSEVGGDRLPAADEHAEEGEGEAGLVKLTPEQTKNAGLGLAQAGPATIREYLSLYGAVAPNAERVHQVAARYPGVILSVTKRIGDPVKQGEVLATVESNESLQTYPVTAPLTGVVTARNANPGEQTGDQALFTVADLSTVWIEISLFPRDMARVRLGQVVRVSSKEANLTAEGKIVYVAPFGSSSNQTLTARVLLANAARKWTPGLYVTAEVILSSASVPLAVASEALQTLEGAAVVFVQRLEGFEPSAVQLGRSNSEFSEVRGGIRAGETYVTKNSFILKAELGKGEAEHGH